MINARAPEHQSQVPLLSVEGLSIAFRDAQGWREVVQNVSFTIGSGETLAIVGESGSGKSVSALSLLRLLPKELTRVSGKAILAGQDLFALSDQQMRQSRGRDLSMIFQEPMTSLNPLFTIGDQISEALLCHMSISESEARRETLRLLDKVRIPAASSRIHDYPHQFSGGMRQRVMIAIALATRPKLLIADEPTTALDVTIQAQILDLIASLKKEDGTSVLFITHDMGVVAQISDRVSVMYKGQQVETAVTQEIFARPQHAYTKALLASVPRLGEMQNHSRPLRFPVVDMTNGNLNMPVEMTNEPDLKQPILEVRNLSKRFDIQSGLFARLTGRVHAVENVSFSLFPGETLALVGESGCGKSTTGRLILRLIEPDSGSLKIRGQDVLTPAQKDLREFRKSVQMIFQDPFATLNPRMTIGQAIAEPFLEHQMGSRQQANLIVSELLKKVGLTPDMAQRYPHEFSGGQRQRICIARALILEPKVIVADESVSALDVSVKAQVINLLLDLQQSLKLSFLFISHDMAVVERVSHRVGVMYLGEIVEIGPRAAVFGNPQHDYTKKLISAVPVPDPNHRRLVSSVAGDELKSPIRAPDYHPPLRHYREISPGHFVAH